MSSDIDIEEHDVFEHPTIKKNFPDLSRIKTEVIEIDSEEASECHSYRDPGLPTASEHDREYFDHDDILDTDNLLAPVYSQNKIILGSKKMPNKIILGSKPKTQEKDPLSVQVILKDWSYILKNHPFYCKQCLILFPTQNTLDAHGMSVHSLLVVKDEIDVELNAVNALQDDSNEALVRCPVCSYYFRTLRNFHIHRVKQHNNENLEPINDTFKGDCLFCSYTYSNIQSYSKHISTCHIDVYKKQIIEHGSLSVNVDTSNSSDYFETVNVNKAKKSTSKCVVVTNKNQTAKKSTSKNVTLIKNENNVAKKSTAKLDTTLKKDSIIGGNIASESTTGGVAVVSQTNNKAVKSTAKSSLDSSVEVDTRKCGLELFKCPICGIYFKYINRYIKHCQTSHQALYLTPRREAFNSLCFCGYKAQNYTMLSKHLSRTHVDIYRKIATAIQEFYCLECNLTFTTANSLHIHKIAKHNENSEPLETVNSQAEESESFRPERNSLKRKSALEASTNSKMTKINGNSSQEDALTKYNNKTKVDEINSSYNSDNDPNTPHEIVILPNKIIFKCPSCSLHFVSSRSAYFHLTQCKGSTADFICSICNLGLKYRDAENHKLQHHLFNKISVIEINQEVFWSLVFVCVDCKVGFDGRVISQHFKCNKDKSTICQECNLKIDDPSLPKHIKIHERGLMPFVVEVIRGDLNDLMISKPNTEDSKNVLYYCHICKSYDPTIQLEHHKKCFCKNNKSFQFCRHCGLRFTRATYEAHIEQHRNRNSKLSEFKFIDIHTGKTIKPKIPDWNKCHGRCKIKYSDEKQRHECFEEKSVYCGICKETFNELAYKIHMQYHEYEIPNDIDDEIMEKYLNMLSLWNIVYRCQYCDIIFDNYDLVIEHSQDHFTEGSYEISKEKCSKCHLTFAKAVFDRHTVLHNGADIDKDSFQILNFNHKNLLNDSWYEIFKPISDEQKNHILGKSIYDLQRRIRLELNFDGPSHNTLFKCAVCEAVVDAPSIIEHANNRDACAEGKQKLDCSVCKLSFLTMQSLSDHKTMHSNAEYKFRILIFNRPDHFEINEPIIKDLRKESLKFKWCQECSVLIKKDQFKAHMLSHRKEPEVARNIPKSNLIYKCVLCKGGIMTKHSLPKHRCLPKRCYSECKYCRLLFLPSYLKRHYDLHKKLSKYHIVPFKNGAILKRGSTKTVTLYQCTKCKVCLQDRYQLRNHTCLPLSQQATCTVCKCKFRASRLNRHMVMHTRIPNITRASVDIVEYTPDSDSTIRHNSIVYKCDCNLLFIKQDKLLKHLCSNNLQQICTRDTNARKCKCGLKFHGGSFEDHLKLHVDCSTVQSYILVNVKLGKGATSDTKRWLWVCATCNVHSMYLKDVNCHTGHTSHNKKLCQICKVYFSKDILGLHIKWHHKILTCNVADLHKKYVRNVSAKELQLECLNRNIGGTVITDFEVDSELKFDDDNVSDNDKPVLYKCVKCDLYFTTDRQFDYHFHAAKHNSAKVKCKFCKFSFTTRMIDVHLNLHHSEPNYKAEDFIIKTVTEDKIKNKKSYQPKRKLDKKYRNILKISSSMKSVLCKKIASTPLEMLKTIHQCGKCQLNTVISTSMDSHMTRSKNSFMCGSKEYLRHTCPQCGLNFTIKSLARHYFVHHTKLNLKREDFNIRIYSSKEKYTTTRPNKTLNEAETSRIIKPQLVKVKKIKPLVTKAGNVKFKPVVAGNVIPKPVLVRAHAKANSKPGYDEPASSTTNEPKHTAVSKKSIEFNENAPRLFKCRDCDVYFATYDMCYDHTLRHKPLDPTEFIACKVCDLQIICECLGVHMKGHREGTFFIDDLVVTEFRARDGPPFVQTYLAAELFDSNLISTTTNCGD